MSDNTIRITRSVSRDNSVKLELLITDEYKNDLLTTKYQLDDENYVLEDDHVWYEFAQYRDIRHMKGEVLDVVRQMRGSGLYTFMCKLASYVTNRYMVQTKVIPLTPKKLKPHFMCGGSLVGSNEISQSELKQKLATVDSKVLKQFEENKCSICCSNYKEILDEDLHIVVSNCGHPLCCKCAENIVEIEKECPQCRGEIDEFNLMKFNADLQIAGNQKLFL